MERFSLRHPGESLRELDPNVRSLGLVSFFADLGSEIVYPLFPIFVTTVLGAPVAVLGLIEGIAEATASITKYPFGQDADYTGRRAKHRRDEDREQWIDDLGTEVGEETHQAEAADVGVELSQALARVAKREALHRSMLL